jgi:uncharacterized protein
MESSLAGQLRRGEVNFAEDNQPMTTHDTFFDAIRSGDSTTVRDLLAVDSSLARAALPAGVSALMLSIYYGKPEITALLRPLVSPLTFYEAAAVGDTPRVAELLDAQPSQIDAFAPDGFTALGLTAYFGHTDAAALLISRRANVNLASTNAQHVAPLHSAVAGQHAAIVKLLLESGANPNAMQEKQFTPLQQAAHNGNLEIARLLLEHGANAASRNEDGLTALDYARRDDHPQVAALLEAKLGE